MDFVQNKYVTSRKRNMRKHKKGKYKVHSVKTRSQSLVEIPLNDWLFIQTDSTFIYLNLFVVQINEC